MNVNFPSDKEFEKINKRLSRGDASATLAPNATSLEKLKYEICKAFVRYKQIHHLSQRDLAELLHVNESIVSKIVHYKIEIFTVDRLMKYLSMIDSQISFQVKVA